MKLRWICATCNRPPDRCVCDRTCKSERAEATAYIAAQAEAPHTGQRAPGSRNRVDLEAEEERGSALLKWLHAEPGAARIAQRLAVSLDCDVIDAAEIVAAVALKVRG